MKKEHSNSWEVYHPIPEPKQTPEPPKQESEFLLGAAQYAYAVGA
jgi:hypothetical protein